MIEVIIVDKEETDREKIKRTIEGDCDIQVIGFANNLRQALILCSRLIPDVMLMDFFLMDCDGLEALKRIRLKYPSLKILLISLAWDAKQIGSALKNGADGCLSADMRQEKIIFGIKSVVNGLMVIDQEMYRLVQSIHDPNPCKIESVWPDENSSQNELTGKQLAILELLAEGLKEEAIACKVGLSINTIKYHKKQIFGKLKVACTNEALVKATRMNLIMNPVQEMVYTC